MYQAPVESDIQSKPLAEKSPVEAARSSIRRSRALRGSHDALRERRRRALLAHTLDSPQRHSPSQDQSESAAIAPPSLVDNITEPAQRVLRETAARIGVLDDRITAMFGTEDSLWSRSTPRFLGLDSREDSADRLESTSSDPRSRSINRTEQYPLSNVRSADHYRRHAARYYAARRAHTERQIQNQAEGRPQADDLFQRYEDRRYVRANGRSVEIPEALLQPTQLDGLGDRNRSLSPEGDHVWDTLLSTLTPDPQPPSVGSSFASASASAVASQSAATGSSSTSLTGPEVADDSALEHPCESGFEGSDTEGEEDAEQRTVTRLDSRRMDNMLALFATRRPAGTRRSYAEVTRRTSRSNSNDDLAGMLRIVTGLARREDIPDEWWAEAGLSRNLSRDTSN